jgi:hypothetical protein
LQVPFYQQNMTQWCVPTSASMVYNFHQGIVGITSNWFLAGRNGQGHDQVTWPHLIAQNAPIPANLYEWAQWDADLIPSNAFTAYVRLNLRGYNLRELYGPNAPNVFMPPRPVQLGSKRLGHAFVAVGANAQNIWLHDSAAVFALTPVIAVGGSWQAFRNRVADVAQTTEMVTLALRNNPRPETERRGSIVLGETTSNTVSDGSFVYFVPGTGGNQAISRWRWEGQVFNQGYYWDDPRIVLPDDATFGNALVRTGGVVPGGMAYWARVANVTSRPHAYTLRVELSGPGGLLQSRTYNRTVPPYSWLSNDSLVQDAFANLGINQAGVHWLNLTLWQNGVLQDQKAVSFVVR